jgi:hypothetical protein
MAGVDMIICELESRMRMPNEHMLHIATLLDHGTRSGAIKGAASVRDIALAMAYAPTLSAVTHGITLLRALAGCLPGKQGEQRDVKARQLELSNVEERCAALEAKCKKQATEIARLQSKCDRHMRELSLLQSKCDRQMRELSLLHAAKDKQRQELESDARAGALAAEQAARLRASAERAEERARAALAQHRRLEERCVALEEELDASAIELARAQNAKPKHVEAGSESATSVCNDEVQGGKATGEEHSECVCSTLGDLAVRVWYLSEGTKAERHPVATHGVSDAESDMSKQLMAVRALTQRLLVESKSADAGAVAATACIELGGELVSFASAPFADDVLGALVRQLPAPFLSCVANADAAGRRRAARVMRVTIGLARRAREGPTLTLEEIVVIQTAANILKKRCSEELMCLCDVVDPLDVLREWHVQVETGGALKVEALHALELVRRGKLVKHAYQMGAKRVFEKTMPKDVLYFRKGSFIKQAEVDDEPETALTRLLAYRASRALVHDTN